MIASFALGLTAKPMLVTLPFVLLLLDYWPLRRWRGAGGRGQGAEKREGEAASRPARGFTNPNSLSPASRSSLQATHAARLVVEKTPLFVLTAASCLVTLVAKRDVMMSLEQLAFPRRVALAAVAYFAYLGKIFCPTGLAVFYPIAREPLPAWEVVAAIAMLLAVSAAVFVARRKCPCLLVGWFWYLGTLVPMIGLVQVGAQVMADRYTYVAQIGICLALAWGAMHVARLSSCGRRACSILSSIVLAILASYAWQQTSYWKDSETLWKHTLACTSGNWLAHYSLAKALADHEQLDHAIAEFQRALEIEPNGFETHYYLGLALRTADGPMRPSFNTIRHWKSSPTTPTPTTAWEMS